MKKKEKIIYFHCRGKPRCCSMGSVRNYYEGKKVGLLSDGDESECDANDRGNYLPHGP